MNQMYYSSFFSQRNNCISRGQLCQSTSPMKPKELALSHSGGGGGGGKSARSKMDQSHGCFVNSS